MGNDDDPHEFDWTSFWIMVIIYGFVIGLVTWSILNGKA